MAAGKVFRMIAVAGALGPAALSAVVAVLATKPRLAAKVFGGQTNPLVAPADFGLESTSIDYAPGCSAWWIPTPEAQAAVIIAHGFEPSEDPRATDPAPRLELAAVLAQAGFSSLVISLGYGSGAHPHSGGALEAADIAAAVRWAAAESHQSVAVMGFSAGGHAAVAAAANCDVFAVVTDSSFVDFAEVVKDQGAEVLGAPAWLFSLAPAFMKLMTGHAPLNLETARLRPGIPMLHIHGDADQAIDYTNLARMARLTNGQTVTVVGADHIESLRTDEQTYRDAVVGFLTQSLSQTTPSVGRSQARS